MSMVSKQIKYLRELEAEYRKKGFGFTEVVEALTKAASTIEYLSTKLSRKDTRCPHCGVALDGRTIVNPNIITAEIFITLCGRLNMNFVLDKNEHYFVKKDSNGNNAVYVSRKDYDSKINDEGDLFMALRNVAVNIFPDLLFRGEDNNDIGEVGKIPEIRI